MHAGYVPILPYILNPLCCFTCQRYNHHKNTCRGYMPSMRRHNRTTSPPLQHVSTAMDLTQHSTKRQWLIEKKVEKTKITRGLSYPEARTIVYFNNYPSSAPTPYPAFSPRSHKTMVIVATHKRYNTSASNPGPCSYHLANSHP